MAALSAALIVTGGMVLVELDGIKDLAGIVAIIVGLLGVKHSLTGK